ncbi:MAG: chemotaxis protein CheW [bacterium]
MLILLFTAGDIVYGIKSKDLTEVVPFMNLIPIPKAPDYLRGIFNYRGNNIPVIDLSMIIKNNITENILSAKILVIRLNFSGEEKTVGLIVKKVNEIIRIDDDKLNEPSVVINEAKFLGKVFTHANKLVQLIEVSSIISEEIKTLLFSKRV